MRSKVVRVAGLCALLVGTSVAVAQPSGSRQQAKVNGLKIGSQTVDLTLPKLETYTIDAEVGYRGMDDFFIVREANSNIGAGQWEFELGMAWSTFGAGRSHDDDFTLTPSLKYGYTDNLHIEIGLLPINLGDGGLLGFSDHNDDPTDTAGIFDRSGAEGGNGDSSLKLFWQMTQESGWMPATALWTELRMPTGEGSEKVDATLNLNITKTFCANARGHLTGFVESANGSRGDGDREEFGDRRDVQWGVGAGMDFTIDDRNLLLINYLQRSSNYDGNSSSSNVELGWTHALSDSQWLLMGVDYSDRNGDHEGARWTGKVQWSIAF